MKPVTCAATRRRLTAFHDGELPVAEQIAVASHLEWCDDCAAAHEDDQMVGHVLRSALPGRTMLAPDEQATFPAAVVNRMRAERSASWPVRIQLMFEDAHLLYAGVASAAALLVCAVVLLGMMRYATSTPNPESLAALIDILTPGSNQNPVVPRPDVLMPRPLDAAFSTPFDEILVTRAGIDEETMVMLAATVTREGRVENLELLDQLGDGVSPDAEAAKVVANLLDAVSHARFEPASVAGLPVAVNMVWMVAHTTVRGTPAAPEPPPASPPAKKRRVASLAESIELALRSA
jgi:hypothetical protein